MTGVGTCYVSWNFGLFVYGKHSISFWLLHTTLTSCIACYNLSSLLAYARVQFSPDITAPSVHYRHPGYPLILCLALCHLRQPRPTPRPQRERENDFSRGRFQCPISICSLGENDQFYIYNTLRQKLIAKLLTVVFCSKAKNIPWKSIVTSPPVWALLLANFTRSWVFATMVTEIPQYFADVFRLNVATVHVLTEIL